MMESTAFIAGIKLGVQGVGTQRFQNLTLDCVQEKEVKTEWGRGLWHASSTHEHSSDPSGVRQLEVNIIKLLIPATLRSVSLWATNDWLLSPGGSVTICTTAQRTTQNVIYSPWGEAESSRLCSKAKLLLFCLAWLISFLSTFSHFD